jgi:hypothetical protein
VTLTLTLLFGPFWLVAPIPMPVGCPLTEMVHVEYAQVYVDGADWDEFPVAATDVAVICIGVTSVQVLLAVVTGAFVVLSAAVTDTVAAPVGVDAAIVPRT